MSKRRKIGANILIWCIALSFLINPSHLTAMDYSEHAEVEFWNRVSLSSRQTSLIIGGMKQSLADELSNAIVSSNNKEKEAALAVLRRGVQINTTNFLMKTAPIEIGIEMAKTVKSIYGWANVDGIIDILKKAGTNAVKKEALSELRSYLEDKKIYVGRAGVKMKYPTLASGGKESQEVHLSFLVLYDFNQGKAYVSVYSPEHIYTPIPTISMRWTGSVEKLPPFILEIDGFTKDSKNFSWDESSFAMNYITDRPVPDLSFENVGWWEDQFNKRKNDIIAGADVVINIGKQVGQGISGATTTVVNTVQNAGRTVGSFFSDLFGNISSLGRASIVTPLHNDYRAIEVTPRPVIIEEEEEPEESFEPTTPSKITTDEVAEEDEEEKDRLMKQIEELQAILADLEKQLAEQEGSAVTGQINLNEASIQELERLSGIGPSLAQRIVDNRIYCSVDDLVKVPGIGSVTVSDIKEQGLAWVEENICTEEVIEEEEIEEEQSSFRCPSQIDINTASLEELECLVGIGTVKAQGIISNRFYCSVDDLVKVNGIGSATVAKIKEQGLASTDRSHCSTGGGAVPASNPEPTPADSFTCPEQIDINTASLEELDCLAGIGPSLAQSIIDNRTYCSIDDLDRVSGIGEKTIENIKEQGLAWCDTNHCEEEIDIPEEEADIPEEEELPEEEITALWITEIQRLPIQLEEEQTYPLSSRFFEIYNPNDEDIDLTGWYIQRSTSGDLGSFITKTTLEGYTIPAKSHFLFAPEESLNPDIETDLTITENNTFAIKNPDGDIVDLVGYGESELFWEESFPENPGNKQSLARKWENGEYINTKNNTNDFEISLIPSPGRENNLVYIPSSALRSTIMEKLEIDIITKEDMASLEKISHNSGTTNKQVLNLTGLEWAVNLKEASFVINGITDLSPLSNLVSLEYLDLSCNEIEDWSPLKDLTNLKGLKIEKNKGYDLSPLSGLTSLEIFSAPHEMQDHFSKQFQEITELRRNRNNPFYQNLGPLGTITDISFMSNLTNLKEIHVGGHAITDISPLVGLPNLERLYLNHNQIGTTISLSSLPNLKEIYLNSNQIEEVAEVSNLPSIKEIYLNDNPLLDISGLTNLGPLDVLSIGGTSIVPDIPLIGEIEHLNINGGEIEDLSALSNNQNKIDILSLANNSLNDSVLPDHAFGGEIRAISLSGNPLDGSSAFFETIESEDLFLLSMTRLKSIPSLSDNVKNLFLGGRQQTFDFSNLKNLHQLENLVVEMIDLKEISNDISGNIKSLSFGSGNLKHLPSFSGLTDIESINISKNLIESSDIIEAQPKELILSFNNITDISPFINVFKTAEKVSLSFNEIEDFEPLKEALNNPNIVVYIGANNIDKELFQETFKDHPRFSEWSY